MFLPQGSRLKPGLQASAPFLAGLQGALGLLPYAGDFYPGAKFLTVALWQLILLHG